MTSVAYCYDVKLDNLAFGLFRNSGKSDLMSTIRKISNSVLVLKDRYLIGNKNVTISTEIQMFSFHWMMKTSTFNSLRETLRASQTSKQPEFQSIYIYH